MKQPGRARLPISFFQEILLMVTTPAAMRARTIMLATPHHPAWPYTLTRTIVAPRFVRSVHFFVRRHLGIAHTATAEANKQHTQERKQYHKFSFHQQLRFSKGFKDKKVFY